MSFHRKAQCLTDPYTGPQKEKDQRTVSRMVDDREQLLHIVGMHGPGEQIGKFESDSFLQRSAGDEFLLDEKVEKGDDAGRARLHRRDVHPAILLVLDEGLQIGSLQIFQVRLSQRSIERRGTA